MCNKFIHYYFYLTYLFIYFLFPGTGLLPGPVRELHATRLTSTSVTLKWEPPQSGNNSTIDYVVHYQKVHNISMYETVLKLDQVCNQVLKIQT